MRLVRKIEFEAGDDEAQDDEASAHRVWRWYVSPSADEGDAATWSSSGKQELGPHSSCAKGMAEKIVASLGLPEPEQTAVVLAAKLHDLGKRRELWQTAIGNEKYPDIVLAKSGNDRAPANRHYRHEFGALLDVVNDADFQKQPPDVRDLILHLIAAHHGRARPHFPADEVFDPEKPGTQWRDVARETPRRFARLQRKYGRWGLAYLESLVRAADAAASRQKENAQ
jgi:CRISPR-associated endonuclease/helicase Cas3